MRRGSLANAANASAWANLRCMEHPMTYPEAILPKFDQEMANTRKVLERIPDDKLDWRPHPKSNTIGWNANHVADLVNWLVQTLTRPSLDVALVSGQPGHGPVVLAEFSQPGNQSHAAVPALEKVWGLVVVFARVPGRLWPVVGHD
jgi:hypothetical protein